ncbi:putative cyclase [Lentinula edodes]|nr:putative cyclase [Lentinula edodes]KAH7874231.1 putative cyclase [Lentinula edodes]KAJ3907560.1 putative cyclase [Lentinula edodes]KAJ3919766.1 putative cyclase [Lentinula edodes]
MNRKREFIDLSHPLDPNNISLWRTMPPFTCCPIATIEKDTFSIHTISMGTHTGTHVDAPCHFIQGGKSIDQIPIDVLHGPALLIDLTHKRAHESISWAEDLSPYAEQMQPGVILLLHTGWSRYWAKEGQEYFKHPYVEPSVAGKLLEYGIMVIGLDAPNPDVTGSGGHPFHEVFLGGGGYIVENLTNLDKLRSMELMVNLLPINIVGSDGAPVRGVAWDEAEQK